MADIIGPGYSFPGLYGKQRMHSAVGGANFKLPDAVPRTKTDIKVDMQVSAYYPGSDQRHIAKVLDISETGTHVFLEWSTCPATSRQRDSALGMYNPSVWEVASAELCGKSCVAADAPDVLTVKPDVLPELYEHVKENRRKDVLARKRCEEISETLAGRMVRVECANRVQAFGLECSLLSEPSEPSEFSRPEPFWRGIRSTFASTAEPVLRQDVVPRNDVYTIIPPTTRWCHSGHHLMQVKLPELEEGTRTCDFCDAQLVGGQFTFTCSLCNYDVCVDCRQQPAEDMARKARLSRKMLMDHGLCSGGMLPTYLAVISSPGDLSEKVLNQGFRCRTSAGHEATKGPLRGALQDCLNIQKAFREGGARLPGRTIMDESFARNWVAVKELKLRYHTRDI